MAIMTKSFSPKLTEREATLLAGFGNDWTTLGGETVEHLANRGLLLRQGRVSYVYDRPSLMSSEYTLRTIPTAYRQTKRGKLMLQRYQKDQDRRKWAEFDRIEQAAQKAAQS